MAHAQALGSFLRRRRAHLLPADVGLPTSGLRRVSGLRREEVALLAGISTDYYLRMEQGRVRHPSLQVLDALARALQLNASEAAHLYAVGMPHTTSDAPVRVPATISQLLRALPLPAFVQDKHFDVLDTNDAARALSPTLVPGANRLLSIFLDPAERRLFADWDPVVTEMVAAFRASVAAGTDERRARELVAQLTQSDPRFRELWAQHDVASRVDRPPVRFAHPVIGMITLTRDILLVDGPGELHVVVYHAATGSPDRIALDELLRERIPGTRRVLS